MIENNKIHIFWFRRDLRLEDNVALHFALKSGRMVLPIFIFDDEILDSLPVNDARVSFIYDSLENIHKQLLVNNNSLLIKKGKPIDIWTQLIAQFEIDTVFFNKDYEPYAITRDEQISKLLTAKGIQIQSFKDQVIFEQSEIVKNDGTPYTVFTPYKNKWTATFDANEDIQEYQLNFSNFYTLNLPFPTRKELGFEKSNIVVRNYTFDAVSNYHMQRDIPSVDATSYLSVYLRFGLISIRKAVKIAVRINTVLLNELIWREFFMQILFHFPKVVTQNFKEKYNKVVWRNHPHEFELWCQGKTGYPMVDAGMRQLNKTGYMHNRVRMIVAGFLCKHLLIDWRWGEAYFAEKLLDFDLSANNGNWQWAAGTGCDAAPYFRVFNPTEQLKKFDKQLLYVKKWIDDLDEFSYPQPMVDHKIARLRAIKTYKKALNSY